jgi:1-acyl-sn-glycerol-3-phosphate acyltransferase
MMRSFISFLKLSIFILWSFLIVIPLIINGFILSKSKKFHFTPGLYHRVTCLIYGIKTQIKGIPNTSDHVVFVGNHLSYIDIPVIGSRLPATFIAKADVRKWPIFGLLSMLAQTIFIERSREAAQKCITDIKTALKKNRSLILFPEGTSTQGVDVLPFKSSIFDLFLQQDLKEKLLIQPFTISVQSIDNKQITSTRDLDTYAWHGEMTMLPHLWAIGKSKGAKILLTFHKPRAASHYDNRKLFAKDCQQDVAEGLKNSLPTTLDLHIKAS